MRLVICCCLLTGCAFGQAPTKTIRRDSVPGISLTDPMPNVRPSNSFYRNPRDPANVVRATLDNMPVKVPDTSMNYTMLRSNGQPVKPNQLPMVPKSFIPPSLNVSPK